MNNGRKMSETEEELKEKFREVFDEYLKEKGEEIPEPDLSFLKETNEREKKKHGHFYRFGTLAVCAVLILTISSGMAVWMNSESAHAMKFNLEKTFHRIADGFFSTDENESAETSENEISITIDSMDDIDDAIAFMPELPVPEYIPEGFELEELKVSKFVNGGYTAQYNFIGNESKTLTININDIESNSFDAGIMMESEKIILPDRSIYYYRDNYFDSYGVIFIQKSKFVEIKSNVSKNMIIKIASSINV